jgi:hypothetical protein
LPQVGDEAAREYLRTDIQKVEQFLSKGLGIANIGIYPKDLSNPGRIKEGNLILYIDQNLLDKHIACVNLLKYRLVDARTQYRKQILEESGRQVLAQNSSLLGKAAKAFLGLNLAELNMKGVDRYLDSLPITALIQAIESARKRAFLDTGEIDIVDLDLHSKLLISSLNTLRSLNTVLVKGRDSDTMRA